MKWVKLSKGLYSSGDWRVMRWSDGWIVCRSTRDSDGFINIGADASVVCFLPQYDTMQEAKRAVEQGKVQLGPPITEWRLRG